MEEETKENIDKRDLEVIELGKKILSSAEVDAELMLIYIQRLLKRQNLQFEFPKKDCKKCNGRGWTGYVAMSKENAKIYPGRLPIACGCVCKFNPIDKTKGIPKQTGMSYNRAKRRKLEKYRSAFKKVPVQNATTITNQGDKNG